MLQVREIRAAALGMAVLTMYLLLVLGSGRIDLGDFGGLWALYLKASLALWIFVGLVVQFGRIAAGARRSGREPFMGTYLRDLVADGTPPFTSHEFGPVLVAKPFQEPMGGKPAMGDECRAGRSGKCQDVEPAYVVGNHQQLALCGLPFHPYVQAA